MNDEGTNRRPAWFFIALGLLTVTGGSLRFHGLGDRDFWFDESCTFIYVHHLFDWPEDSSLLAESTNLPYYVLLRGWVSLFGDSEAGYRSMSALAGTLAVALLGLLGWRIGGPVTGLISGLVVAFHPLHIHYAHEARAYALWTLHLSCALLMLYEAARRARWGWWVAYGVVLLACLHLHYFTAYWVPATAAVVAIAAERRRVLRQWFITTTVVGLGFLPYFFAAVLPAARGGGSAWIARHWEPVTAIPRTLWAFMPAGAYPAHLRGLSLASPDTVRFENSWLITANGIARTIPVIVVLGVFIMLARKALAERRNRADGRRGGSPHLFLGGLTLGPLILAWAYSVIVRPNYLVGRYDLVAWSALLIWIALSINQVGRLLTPRRAHAGAIAICLPLLACSIVPLVRMFSLKPPPTFHRMRAQRLAELAGPGDLVIAFSYDRDYLLYYLHRAGFRGSIVSYPSWLDQQIGWVDTEADLAPDRLPRLEHDAAERVELADKVMARGGCVWLLVDSLKLQSTDPRADINRRLLLRAIEAGYEAVVADEILHILELRRPASGRLPATHKTGLPLSTPQTLSGRSSAPPPDPNGNGSTECLLIDHVPVSAAFPLSQASLMEPSGLEPPTSWLQTNEPDDVTSCKQSTSESNIEGCCRECCSEFRPQEDSRGELALVVQCWAHLPEHIRRAIVALVQTGRTDDPR